VFIAKYQRRVNNLELAWPLVQFAEEFIIVALAIRLIIFLLALPKFTTAR
jgi:hypothetical protein